MRQFIVFCFAFIIVTLQFFVWVSLVISNVSFRSKLSLKLAYYYSYNISVEQVLSVPDVFKNCFQIKLGTVDQAEAQIEWVIRPYMNTTKKRKFLSN